MIGAELPIEAEPAHAAEATGAEVQLVDLSRSYGSIAAVRQLNVSVRAGEFLTFLGASGSGKTTTLMMIAGFVTPSDGDILIGGRSVVRLPADKRNLGVVFQSYALFPHMSVADNVGFPLRMRGLDKAAIGARVSEALAMVHLDGLGARRIDEISGGQQQRVALARALVYRPPVLLMDEPLGALDRQLRESMQAEIKRIQRQLGLTVIYVTHDQEEALVMSDRIAIMRGGEIQQIDTPTAIYEHPVNAYVAQFLGESNVLDGLVKELRPQGTVIRSASGWQIEAPAASFAVGAAVRAMIRPEAILIARADNAAAGENRLNCVIEDGEYLGQSVRYYLHGSGIDLIVREPRRPGGTMLPRGAAVTAVFGRADVQLFPPEFA